MALSNDKYQKRFNNQEYIEAHTANFERVARLTRFDVDNKFGGYYYFTLRPDNYQLQT